MSFSMESKKPNTTKVGREGNLSTGGNSTPTYSAHVLAPRPGRERLRADNGATPGEGRAAGTPAQPLHGKARHLLRKDVFSVGLLVDLETDPLVTRASSGT